MGCEKSLYSSLPQLDWNTTLEQNWLDSMQKTWQITQQQQLLMLASIDTATNPTQLANHFKGQLLDSFALRQLNEAAITLVKNRLLPLSADLDQQTHLVYLQDIPPAFESRLPFYTAPIVHHWALSYDIKALEKADQVIFVCFNQHLKPTVDQQLVQDILKVAKYKDVVLVNFDNITNLRPFENLTTLVQVPSNDVISQDLAAQLLFGGIQAKGHLALTLSEQLQKNQGIQHTPVVRLKYTMPQEVKMNPAYLAKIEYQINRAIRKKAIPGGQVLIAKDGKVVYQKAYGHHTYEKKQAVKPSDSYDIASITKIAATTLALMKLEEQGKYDIQDRIKTHLPKFEKARWRNVRIRHLLTHRSGLQTNAPISQFVRISNKESKKYKQYFSNHQNEDYPIQITEDLFMSLEVEEKLWKDIAKVRPSRNRKYTYSDLNFELLQSFIESKTAVGLDEYVAQHFYHPLGLNQLTFNPLQDKVVSDIVPTIQDKKWRNKLLKGEVHDETAALFGGVAGHAGLFSNANDLAIFGQLLLNKGVYGGKRYLKAETVELFTKRQHGHRGLGFDIKTSKGAPGCYTGASSGTFGHSGFTGTCIWIDPVENMVYVFLSNRVHPSPKNKKLMQLKTREKVHRLAYKALQQSKTKKRKYKRKSQKRDKLYANRQQKKALVFHDQQSEWMGVEVD